MPIDVSCDCGRHLRLADRLGGKRIRCPECSSVVDVPIQKSSAKPRGRASRRKDATPQQAGTLPPRIRSNAKKKKKKTPTPSSRPVVAWSVLGILACGIITAAVIFLPGIVASLKQTSGEAHRADFHGFSFEVPSSLEFVKVVDEEDIRFEGKTVGTFNATSYKSSTKVLFTISHHDWLPQQTVQDENVQNLLRTSDSITAAILTQYTEGAAATYDFTDMEEVDINGLTFARCNYTGQLGRISVVGREYTFRDGSTQLQLSAVTIPGRSSTDFDLLDELCSTIKRGTSE